MRNSSLEKNVEEFIHRRGIGLDSYYIEVSPFSEMLCYRTPDGREFDLLINDPKLANAVIARLKQLGARIVKLS